MKKVLIDCTSLARKKTGIEHYTEQLCQALVPLLQNRGFTPVLLCHGEKPAWIEPEVECLSYQGKSAIILNIFWIPWKIYRVQPSAALFPAFPPSPLLYFFRLLKPTDIIRIVYDAVMWLHKDKLSIRNSLYYKPLETLGITRYKKIATISANSMQEIIGLFPEVAGRIVNIGCAPVSRVEKPDELIENCYPKGRYLLFVGTVDKRKNLTTALMAFKQFAQEDTECQFVITGRDAWGSKEVATVIQTLGIENRVVMTGYVSEQALVGIYRHAEALVFPSIYEGYGLPVVEAMSLGCPVIASNTSAIPEAAGGAALLVDNITDPQAWCTAMLRIRKEPGLREELVGRGLARVKKLSWNQVASRMMDLISDGSSVSREL